MFLLFSTFEKFHNRSQTKPKANQLPRAFLPFSVLRVVPVPSSFSLTWELTCPSCSSTPRPLSSGPRKPRGRISQGLGSRSSQAAASIPSPLWGSPPACLTPQSKPCASGSLAVRGRWHTRNHQTSHGCGCQAPVPRGARPGDSDHAGR